MWIPNRALPMIAGAGLLFAVACIGAPARAHAAVSPQIPDGVVRDASFDDNEPTVVMGSDRQAARVFCPDRAFTAVVKMSTSVPGCNVIGTNASVKVTYGWYKHVGNSNPCIWGKGFDSKAKPIWTELSCGTGRTKAVSWGNVAASKQIQGLTVIGWAGVQWS